jgi:hypothetical protein
MGSYNNNIGYGGVWVLLLQAAMSLIGPLIGPGQSGVPLL